MTDTCAGGGICPRGSRQTARKDATVTTTQFVTALDDSAHGNVDELHFESHKFQVQCNEADVGFSISSAGKTSKQRDWFEFDESYQVVLPGPGGQNTTTCAKDPNVAKLEGNRRVYWLPGSATESTDGAPWCIKFRVAELAVEASPNSETDFDVNAAHLEESEETRRLKHKTLPRHVSKDKHDARQIAHLQSRSRSGKKADHAYRHQASTHEGEDGRGKDHLFSSNATDPQHVKAVLSVMSGNGVEARLVFAREAFRPTDRTRLNEMRAVNNLVCNTPKAPSANAGETERAMQKVEKRSRTSRSWFEGVSVERVCKVMLCVADNTPPCEARQNETDQEAVWTITQRPGVGVHRVGPFQKTHRRLVSGA